MALDGLDMASSPWTITSKKRKSTPLVNTTTRKRPRRNDTTSTSSRHQQTLTQAQWINRTPSFADEASMTPITPIPTTLRRRMKKNDSTLTQMDFFGNHPVAETDYQGLMAMPENHENDPVPVRQVDGNWESPRRRRKRKSPPVLKAETTESQEYQPTQKVTHYSGAEMPVPRRSARRGASRPSILSDPADNLDYFKQALEEGEAEPRVLPVEIKDSLEDEDEPQIPNPPPQTRYTTPKKTARGTEDVIRSSQTPESLPPSIKPAKRYRSAIAARSPFRELSTNIVTRMTGLDVVTTVGNENEAQGPTARLKRRKLQQASKTEISQTNLWSIPPTSSPDKNASVVNSCTERQSTQATETRASASDCTPIEIPSTSQIDEENSQLVTQQPQASTTNTEDAFWNETPPKIRYGANDPSQQSVQSDAQDNTSSETTGETIATTQSRAEFDTVAMPPPATPRTVRIDAVEDSEAEDSDFGSPIRNDTQYNFEVKHRTSSPTAPENHSPARPTSSHTPIPTPRLVRHSSPREVIEIESDSNSDNVSLPPQAPPVGIPMDEIRRVPLNDTLPSSSPPVRTKKAATQRSVHPASMPHPSQISTQEATQGYLGSSYMPFETPQATQRITVKDSSSARLPMSQVPPQPSQSQLNVDLGLDAFGTEGEDFDLDPPSSAPERQQARKTKARSVQQDEIPTEPISWSSEAPSSRTTEKQVDLVSTIQQASAHTTDDALHHHPAQTAHPHPDEEPASDGHPDTSENKQTASPRNQSTTTRKRRQPAPAASPTKTADSPLLSSSQPKPLERPIEDYTQLEGYNNETQSNFTQGGHVSAAYVHRAREAGILPKWYTPKPFKAPGYTRR